MEEYKKILLEKSRLLEKNIHSNHTGVDYDVKSIIDPRRFQVGANPSIGMAQRSFSVFN